MAAQSDAAATWQPLRHVLQLKHAQLQAAAARSEGGGAGVWGQACVFVPAEGAHACCCLTVSRHTLDAWRCDAAQWHDGRRVWAWRKVWFPEEGVDPVAVRAWALAALTAPAASDRHAAWQAVVQGAAMLLSPVAGSATMDLVLQRSPWMAAAAGAAPAAAAEGGTTPMARGVFAAGRRRGGALTRLQSRMQQRQTAASGAGEAAAPAQSVPARVVAATVLSGTPCAEGSRDWQRLLDAPSVLTWKEAAAWRTKLLRLTGGSVAATCFAQWTAVWKAVGAGKNVLPLVRHALLYADGNTQCTHSGPPPADTLGVSELLLAEWHALEAQHKWYIPGVPIPQRTPHNPQHIPILAALAACQKGAHHQRRAIQVWYALWDSGLLAYASLVLKVLQIMQCSPSVFTAPSPLAWCAGHALLQSMPDIPVPVPFEAPWHTREHALAHVLSAPTVDGAPAWWWHPAVPCDSLLRAQRSAWSFARLHDAAAGQIPALKPLFEVSSPQFKACLANGSSAVVMNAVAQAEAQRWLRGETGGAVPLLCVLPRGGMTRLHTLEIGETHAVPEGLWEPADASDATDWGEDDVTFAETACFPQETVVLDEHHAAIARVMAWYRPWKQSRVSVAYIVPLFVSLTHLGRPLVGESLFSWRARCEHVHDRLLAEYTDEAALHRLLRKSRAATNLIHDTHRTVLACASEGGSPTVQIWHRVPVQASDASFLVMGPVDNAAIQLELVCRQLLLDLDVTLEQQGTCAVMAFPTGRYLAVGRQSLVPEELTMDDETFIAHRKTKRLPWAMQRFIAGVRRAVGLSVQSLRPGDPSDPGRLHVAARRLATTSPHAWRCTMHTPWKETRVWGTPAAYPHLAPNWAPSSSLRGKLAAKSMATGRVSLRWMPRVKALAADVAARRAVCMDVLRRHDLQSVAGTLSDHLATVVDACFTAGGRK